jgi:glucose-1-phosphatase
LNRRPFSKLLADDVEPIVIRFVYFDLGNVLVNFSHARMCSQIAEVLNVAAEEVRAAIFDNYLQDRYETGRLTTEEFCEQLNSLLGTAQPQAEIVLAASEIFWLNEPILPLVEALKGNGLPLGILSNTCDAHWRNVTAGAMRPHLEEFSQVVLSYEARSKKPDPAIYEVARQRAGCRADEILFLDDRGENVAGAVALGWDAHLYTSVESFGDLLRQKGLV